MCGFGRITYESKNPEVTGTAAEMGYSDYTGSFYDDHFHGVGIQEWHKSVYVGEFQMGKRHGYSTVYFHDGAVLNMIFE